MRGSTAFSIASASAEIRRINALDYFDPKIAGLTDQIDEELRARVLDSYINISNGANAAYYKSLALSVSGISSLVVPINEA